MPKVKIDYSKTVIYKIVCNDLNITDCYVGQTTNFTKRKNQHKSVCSNSHAHAHNRRLYSFIRNNGNWDNWEMIEIEKYPCIDNNEATAKERKWFEQLQATLNYAVPNRSDKEYHEENKEKIETMSKIYREAHKEHKKIYDDGYKQQRKIHRQLNRDELNRKQREYKAKKKEELS